MMSGDEERRDKRIKRLKGYLLYGAEKFKVALLCNVYPKFSVDFSWAMMTRKIIHYCRKMRFRV